MSSKLFCQSVTPMVSAFCELRSLMHMMPPQCCRRLSFSLSFHIAFSHQILSPPHRAFLKCKLRRKMHACREPERVCVEHRVVWIEALCHSRVGRSVLIYRLRGRRRLHRRDLLYRLHRLHRLHRGVTLHARRQLLSLR